MFPMRRVALRFLSTPSTSFIAKSRTIATFTPSPLRISRQIPSVQFQRRWATGEAEAQKEEVPVSQIQPTAQEEVENAIHEDNEGQSSEASVTHSTPAAETANANEASESASTSGKSALDSTIDSVSNAATQAKDAVQESVRITASAVRGERPAREVREPAEPKRTIYVGNLFFDVTENDLVKELARFGSVKRARLIRDGRGLSKGFGYVEFESIEQATKAIEGLNQQLFEGRRLNVQFATHDASSSPRSIERANKPLNPPTKTLFVGNMSFEMTDRDLNNLFRGIRNVIDVRVAIDRRTGQPRGFAHADFVDVKSAMEALKALDGKETYGRRLRVDYSYGPSTAPRYTPPEE